MRELALGKIEVVRPKFYSGNLIKLHTHVAFFHVFYEFAIQVKPVLRLPEYHRPQKTAAQTCYLEFCATLIQCRSFLKPKQGRGIKMSIEQRVKKIVAEQLGVNESEVKNESSFVNDLGADSLDTVELVMALEEEFECEIPDEDAEKITTVQQAIDYVLAHQK